MATKLESPDEVATESDTRYSRAALTWRQVKRGGRSSPLARASDEPTDGETHLVTISTFDDPEALQHSQRSFSEMVDDPLAPSLNSQAPF